MFSLPSRTTRGQYLVQEANQKRPLSTRATEYVKKVLKFSLARQNLVHIIRPEAKVLIKKSDCEDVAA